MRKIAILTFQTLDGVMQAPSHPEEDTSENFTLGGWAQEHWAEVMEQVKREAMAAPYDLLLGRNTYDAFAQHFSTASTEDPVARRLNAATKYVLTSRPLTQEWSSTVTLSGDILTSIRSLKAQSGPLLQVHGSWALIQGLLQHDLIDEFRIWTFPVVLGKGKRLFDKGIIPHSLQLIKSETCPGGAVMTIFKKQIKTG